MKKRYISTAQFAHTLKGFLFGFFVLFLVLINAAELLEDALKKS
jgi:hypothetical protein